MLAIRHILHSVGKEGRRKNSRVSGRLVERALETFEVLDKPGRVGTISWMFVGRAASLSASLPFGGCGTAFENAESFPSYKQGNDAFDALPAISG